MARQKLKFRINLNHMLMGCRFDVWLRLLGENRFQIRLNRVPEALVITLFSLLLYPAALLERLLFAGKVRSQQVREPLFILGHWRSGTTFLQNILTRDPARGYFDPPNTVTVNNAVLLSWLFYNMEKKILPDSRPMDNLKYGMDLPMEDVVALTNLTTLSIDHLLFFPRNYDTYLNAAFVDELPEKKRRAWRRVYHYLLQKQTWRCQGKPLVLKSPDSTCRAAELWRMYPDAKFVHIYRDPYRVIPSTINMFLKLFDRMQLQPAPEREFMEDMIVALFGRVYRKLFADMELIPPQQLVEIKYEDFERDPNSYIREIYRKLDLSGYEAAAPHFAAYIASQSDYQKNTFRDDPRLMQKINRELGFYFERYGYQMREE